MHFGLCVTLRKPLRPQRLNFTSPKVQQTFTAEDAEDFAKARRGLRTKRVSSRSQPVDGQKTFCVRNENKGLTERDSKKTRKGSEGAKKN